MSPEQIRRSDQVDARSDIWAVGCVLFELLTGVTAFDEPSLLELSAAILERDPVPLQALRPDANDELEAVILRCLSKNPDERYQNVADLAIALYPFAPRRARISVERCYHILKNAGIVSTELEIASAYPPPISGKVTSGAFPTAAALRRSTSAGVDIVAPAEPPRAAAGGVNKLAIAALVAVAAAGGFFALNASRTPPPASASAATPTKAVEPAQQASTPSARAGRVIDLDQDVPGSSTSGAQPNASAPRANRAGKAPRPVRALPTASGVKRTRSGEDELDPGF
jgi:serine/threonine-protein kinase